MKTAGLLRFIRHTALIVVTAICCALSACGDAGADKSSFDARSESEAKEMLMAFVRSGANVRDLSSKLRPTKADYESVFSKEFAARLYAQQDAAWANGVFTVSPKPGQTEVSVRSIPTTEIRSWTPQA